MSNSKTFSGATKMAAGALIFMLGICGATSVAAKTTLKFSSFTSERNPIFQCSIIPMLEDIKARSNGAIEIEEYFGGGAFGAPAQQFNQVSRGVTDMAFGVVSYNEGQFLLTELIGLPLVSEDHERATRVLNEQILPKYLGNEFAGVKVINLWVTSPMHFHMRDQVDPVNLNGARVMTNAETAPFLQALGAQVATLPVTAAYENLQRGAVDGNLGTWTSVRAFRVGEVTKYHYNVSLGSAIGFTLMNRRTYDRLPPDIKALIDEHSGLESSMTVARCFTEVDERVRAELRERGNDIVELTPEQREELQRKLAPVIESHLQRVEQRGLPAREVFEIIQRETGARF